MDAVEFYKAFKRMCDKTDCKDCLLDQKCRPSANVEPEEVVELVEEWAKEHPVKTRQSELLKMFPKAAICDDVISICPLFYCVNFLGTNFQGYCHNNRANCNKCCREYWLTEVTNND